MADKLITGMAAGSEVQPGQLTFFDDINAVRMHLYQSLLGPKSYLLQRKRGTFDRSTYLIQSLNQAWTPGGSYAGSVDHNMLVEFYALEYEEAMRVAGDLMLLFASPSGLVLPYWDMTDPENPVVLYDDWWEKNAGFPPRTVHRLGVRVLEDTITMVTEQEQTEVAELEHWTVSLSFRMMAPRVLFDLNDPAVAGKVLREVKLSGFVTGSSAGFVSA